MQVLRPDSGATAASLLRSLLHAHRPATLGRRVLDRQSSPFDRHPPAEASPQCRASPNQLDVFWVADDGAIWSTWWSASHNGGRWNAPFPITAANVAPPGGHIAAVALTSRPLGCVLGRQRRRCRYPLVERRPGRRRLAPTPALPNHRHKCRPARRGRCGGVSQSNHLDVFWADNGGAIGTQWWNGQAPNGDGSASGVPHHQSQCGAAGRRRCRSGATFGPPRCVLGRQRRRRRNAVVERSGAKRSVGSSSSVSHHRC